jgi:hypothetical protein
MSRRAFLGCVLVGAFLSVLLSVAITGSVQPSTWGGSIILCTLLDAVAFSWCAAWLVLLGGRP